MRAIIVSLLCLVAFYTRPAVAAERGEAIFAAGCFWCVEAGFEKVAGVTAVISGYDGGKKERPTYEEVGSGATGHAESVRVLYDPSKVSYAHLLEVFWHNVDPFSANGQFCDRGTQYRASIFYLDEAQRKAAEASKKAIEAQLKAKVVTEISPATPFFPAEDYHQDFYKKNPERYQSYRLGCGRDRRLHEIWGDAANSH
jgi:peptide-methionine (S)-S-oxide reductase